MAGESPDRSEQRKSSGTAEERDPRFAVFREPVAEAGGSAAGGTTDAVTDSETAVFRLPHAEQAGVPEGGSPPPEPSERPEGASGPRQDAGEGREPQKAAGTSTTASEAPVEAEDAPQDGPDDEAEGESPAEAGDGEGSGRSAADERPGAGATDAASGPGRPGAGTAPGTEPAPRSVPEGAPEATAEAASGSGPDGDAKSGERAEAASGSGSRTGSDAGADAGSTPPDARLRAAVAAWVATEPGEEAAGGSGDDESAGKPSEGGLAVGGDSDASSAGADGTPDAGTDAHTDAEAGLEADSDDDDAHADGEAEAGTEAVTGGSDAERDSGTRPAAGSGAGASGGSAAGDPADTLAEDSAGADAGDPAGTGAEDSAGTGDVPAAAGASDDVVRVPRTREESSPAKEPELAHDGRGIDHPTAVFKAPRAGKTDQPTTALKLPPKEKEAARKPASWAAKASGTPESPASPASPEAPAERTSKFVPLRSDDVRPAAVVGPTVTPDVAARPGTPGAPGAGLTEAERTRQQPMPPKPPLDLLAELTNTPPPPETPVRTAVRRVKIWTPLVLLLLVVFAIAQAMRPLPEPVLELTAKQTYDFEGGKPSLPWPDEGQGFMTATGLGTVDSFGEQKAVPIGSVAKAMTAYVVLKDHPLKRGEDGASVKIDAKAEEEGKLDSVGESTLNTVKAGETITQQDALSAIMIPSANNIARLLARWDAGSEEAFVKKMNDTAKELGMTKTTYTDPSGLNATTVSSAEDQVKLGEKLVEIPALMDITKLPSWTDPSGQSHRNYNTLVPYDGALGIKTGSTTKAGGNLLFAAHKQVGGTDQLIVGAILGQHKPPIIDTVNSVSQKAMVATQDLLESRTVVKKGQVVGVVDDGFGRTTDVVVAEDVKAVGWPGLTVKLELTDDGKKIPNAAAAGTRVGTMTVGEGASQVEVAVTLGDALAEPSFGDKLTRVT
ncbi:D-alanyl-D-alanine carboxypeptidase [Streptomyces sp. ALB3]|uniref:D-alanyl-D-alanine carboxypeptidase n=1 Tax=Streptomyces sp. ALB3 TaxID=3374278 RepID=UPI0037B3617C